MPGSLSQPETAEAWASQAIHLRKSNPQAALAAASEALKRDPSLASMWDCIGFLLLERGRWHEARSYLKEASKLVPTDTGFRSHYAIALMEDGDLREAHREISLALHHSPDTPELLFVMAEILSRAGTHDLAIPFYQAARTSGEFTGASMVGEAAASFIGGGFARGMELMAEADRRPTFKDVPLWQGQYDAALHLLLTGEYGFGDLLQFARYITPAAERVGHLTLHLPFHLARVMRSSFPDVSIVAYDVPQAATKAELQAQQISEIVPQDVGAKAYYTGLPHLLNPSFDAGSASVPYVHADPLKAASWRETLAHMPHPRIGIVWAGNPRNQNDHNRSVPFEVLQPLIALARPHLVSLQRDAGRDKARAAGIFDAAELIKDFSDSAALMSELDLVIATCSAPAHLAGALGRPVWTMLSFHANWRWLLGRDDTIWYPTMRLYRQSESQNWANVIQSIHNDLGQFLGGNLDVLEPPPAPPSCLRRHPNAIIF